MGFETVLFWDKNNVSLVVATEEVDEAAASQSFALYVTKIVTYIQVLCDGEGSMEERFEGHD